MRPHRRRHKSSTEYTLAFSHRAGIVVLRRGWRPSAVPTEGRVEKRSGVADGSVSQQGVDILGHSATFLCLHALRTSTLLLLPRSLRLTPQSRCSSFGSPPLSTAASSYRPFVALLSDLTHLILASVDPIFNPRNDPIPTTYYHRHNIRSHLLPDLLPRPYSLTSHPIPVRASFALPFARSQPTIFFARVPSTSSLSRNSYTGVVQ